MLASGAGSNLQALLDDDVLGSRIAGVVSDREAAGALDRARLARVPARYANPMEHEDRASFGRSVSAVLDELRATHVVLAGFMRILDADLVRAWEGRMLNIHPSLLPAFPGATPVRDALDWGVKVTGVTVHLVDEQVDHGPIVLQEAVPVVEGDDESTLHARIQRVEHTLYPRAVRLLVEGRLKVEGRRVHTLGTGQ